MAIRYVPALRDRQAELFALAKLPRDLRAQTLPLLMVQEPRPSRGARRWSRERELRRKVRDPDRGVVVCWGHEHPMLVDLSQLDPEPVDRRHPAFEFLDWSWSLDMWAVPVIGPDAPCDYRDAIRSWCQQSEGASAGVGIRVRPAHLGSRMPELHALSHELGVPRRHTDLIIDLGRRSHTTSDWNLRAITWLLGRVGTDSTWRRVTLLGGSFPSSLSTRLDHDARARFPRYEQELFEQVASSVSSMRTVLFGDYGVVSTQPAASWRGAATIRYTTRHDWLVLRGHHPSKAPTGEHTRLANELIVSDEWRGADHCAGCLFIAQHAETGGGSTAQWRQADFAHHIACTHEIRSGHIRRFAIP